MKLKKYLYNYAHSIGASSPNNNFKDFVRSLQNYKVEDFTEEELVSICNIVKKGLKSDFGVATYEYFESTYGDSKVLETLYAVAENGDYDYADNFRISDGSALEDALYFVAQFHGCCGYHDTTLNVDGKEYKVGFNYGH